MKAKHILILLLAMMAGNVAGARDKDNQAQKIYIFGIAASFTDTIVHFTPIQEVDSVSMDKKKRFLMGRQEYSYQLRNYLADKLGMPQRTCIVVYDKKLKKAEQRRAKMMDLYNSPTKNGRCNDVRYIPAEDFRFHSVDMRPAPEEAQSQEQQEQQNAGKGNKKQKKKKDAKGGRP